ncbi:adenosylmethionine decarboxylase [Deefgea tanakiae]|uniref:S-adenosylmethionine decarboxylase proenzyme n=1 Tax=Deefgea tanakiae TaxID=2865840 RepID=A0ABX8Z8R7_9NEIS|nr:adenosylmethionine decarboxylase [Deefgea tanakiae]QZA78982.1 adenosylmethionine decarboxylase [Deefgea tanakiae]
MHVSISPPKGQHVLADLYGCDAQQLANPEWIADCLLLAAQAAGATVLNSHFHHFGEQQGVTGVLLLMESHISIHTWPEHGYAAIDLFMCGQAQVDAALCSLISKITSKEQSIQLIERGF